MSNDIAPALPLDLDSLRDVALLATGRNWVWNDYRVPDLMATVGDPDLFEYQTEVIEAGHDGGCGCRRECHLELNIAPQDAEFIAATGPDVVLALIHRIRDLESQNTGEPSDAEVLAALNSTVKPASAAPDLSFWGEDTVAQMRTSLLASQQARLEREVSR